LKVNFRLACIAFYEVKAFETGSLESSEVLGVREMWQMLPTHYRTIDNARVADARQSIWLWDS
ncbi:MAG: hypothetical protein NWE87_02065, partial [Candidatus Bathyarchaeota archaeon]|nr:hypothetical protein [Candidatus Bathyarchaeota archaeon]